MTKIIHYHKFDASIQESQRWALIMCDFWEEYFFDPKILSVKCRMTVRPPSLSLIFLAVAVRSGVRMRRQSLIRAFFLRYGFYLWCDMHIESARTGGVRAGKATVKRGWGYGWQEIVPRPDVTDLWGFALACCRISELNGRLRPEHNRMWLKRTDERGKWVFDTVETLTLHTHSTHRYW